MSRQKLTQGDFDHTAFLLSTVFKPTSPIDQGHLFAGHQSQIRDVVDTINQQGQHAVLYGGAVSARLRWQT